MNSKLIRPLVSCLLIIALLVPAVAQAMPAAPASPQTWPAETLRDYAVPAWPQSTGANDADSGSSVDSAASNEPVGRLLLSPAIDADGDPLTNPVGSAPVARFGGAQPDPANDVLYAVIGLAAEVIPDDRQHNPAGIMVSFRIWHETSPVELVKEARSDAWGAAAVEQIFDDLHLTGRWFYQASVSGYGETPVRSFGFDTSSYSDDTRLGAARLTTQIEADGRLVVEIELDVPSSELMLAVELLAVQLIPTSDELAPPERKVLPPMVARRLRRLPQSGGTISGRRQLSADGDGSFGPGDRPKPAGVGDRTGRCSPAHRHSRSHLRPKPGWRDLARSISNPGR